MTLDDSGWILTKADFWRREVGECSLSGRAKVPDIKEALSGIFTFIKEAL